MPYNRQNEIIEYLVDKLNKTKGVRALYLKGSIANGTDDDYSDVDFYCLVDENEFDKLLNIRLDLLAGYRKMIYQSFVNFGDPQIVVIYDNDLHVDLYIKKEVLQVGSDKIKVLYDRDNIFTKYEVDEIHKDRLNIVEKLNGVIYTYHELNIAIKRKDFLWASRLQSHILADLSLVLDDELEKEKSYLHMKGLMYKLPSEIQDKVSTILECTGIENFNVATSMLIDLTETIITRQSREVVEKLHLKYLNYIKENHFE